MPVPDVVVQGECDPAFAGVRDAFAANFAAGLELGASLCVEVDGRAVVDLWGGWLDAEQRATLGTRLDRLRVLVHQGAGGDRPPAPGRPRRGGSRRAGRSLLARVRRRGQGRAAGAVPAHARGGAVGDREADAVRFAVGLERDGRRARRAGAVVGARFRSRLPRRDLRPSRRRGRAPGRRPHDRRVPPRRDHRAARRRLLPRPARGGGCAHRDDGPRADRGPDVLLALGTRLARAEVVREPSRLQRPRAHEHAHVPRGRDPRRERARERACAGARVRRRSVPARSSRPSWSRRRAACTSTGPTS